VHAGAAKRPVRAALAAAAAAAPSQLPAAVAPPRRARQGQGGAGRHAAQAGRPQPPAAGRAGDEGGARPGARVAAGPLRRLREFEADGVTFRPGDAAFVVTEDGGEYQVRPPRGAHLEAGPHAERCQHGGSALQTTRQGADTVVQCTCPASHVREGVSLFRQAAKGVTSYEQ
jgi:hypothetical protein